MADCGCCKRPGRYSGVNQDFIAWDVASEAILYESPKIKWNPFERLMKAFERSGLQLNNLSQDGRFLLVTKYDRLVIYEIIFREASGPGGASPVR